MSTAPTVATKDMTEALKLFMQAKIGCANTIHDVDTLDGITDGWPSDKPTLAGFALEIHLSCEAGMKEAHAMVDILDHFMEQISKDGTSSVFEFVELDCRQELALHEVRAIAKNVGMVEAAAYEEEDIALSAKEMGKRCTRVKAKLDGLKIKIEELRVSVGPRLP